MTRCLAETWIFHDIYIRVRRTLLKHYGFQICSQVEEIGSIENHSNFSRGIPNGKRNCVFSIAYAFKLISDDIMS